MHRLTARRALLDLIGFRVDYHSGTRVFKTALAHGERGTILFFKEQPITEFKWAVRERIRVPVGLVRFYLEAPSGSIELTLMALVFELSVPVTVTRFVVNWAGFF